ncbi:MAG TPA: NAD-dependent epimerase/dehydratase family protein [Gemmatimonadota bacterium]|nr:NAD-dependent epimerase/dehydratase family protein [Gemmatimonadota bacterium]
MTAGGGVGPGRILVTGGAGFIGSHLCEALISRGAEVVAFDSFDPFYPRAIKERNLTALLGRDRFRLVEGDLREPADVEAALAAGRFDAVAHLAARAGVRPSLEDPGGYMSTNIGGTAVLLEGMRRAGCSRLVFGSSSSVYGNSRDVPLRETDRVDRPVSPYAMTKKAGEELCHVYHHAYGFSVMSLRFFTVYGPRQRPDMAIHRFVRLMEEGRPIPVFGDGTTERDYTYFSDIVAGVVAAVDWVRREDGFEIVNLGESVPVRLDELIAELAEATGRQPRIERLPMPLGDVERTCADIGRARELLGYDPSTGIKEGVEAFVRWYREVAPARAT